MPVPFRFADLLRPDAARAVETLRRLGLSVEIPPGDATSAVAAAAGVSEWRAGAS